MQSLVAIGVIAVAAIVTIVFVSIVVCHKNYKKSRESSPIEILQTDTHRNVEVAELDLGPENVQPSMVSDPNVPAETVEGY